jgi:hypothetical protein
LQKLALSPNASAINVVFTKHITNALMKIKDEKLKQKASIPKKLEDVENPSLICMLMVLIAMLYVI